MNMDNDLYIDNQTLETVAPWDGAGGGGDPIPPGEYEAVITEMSKAPNSKGTGVNLVVKYEIVANADGTETDQKGRVATGWYPVSGKGEGRLKQFLMASGVEFDGKGYDMGAALGKSIIFEIAHTPKRSVDTAGNVVESIFWSVQREQPIAFEEEAEEEAPPPAKGAARNGNGNGNGRAPAKAAAKPAAKPAARARR